MKYWRASKLFESLISTSQVPNGRGFQLLCALNTNQSLEIKCQQMKAKHESIVPYHLIPKSLTSYYLSYLCFTYWQSPFVSSRKGTIHSGLSIHHPKQKETLCNKWQPSEKQSVLCFATKVHSRKVRSALSSTLCIYTSLKYSHWTYSLWKAGGTAPFWSFRKENQVWNHSFTANTNNQWLTSAVGQNLPFQHFWVKSAPSRTDRSPGHCD